MRNRRTRKLTPGEIALARTAFGPQVDYARVRLSDGPGLHPFAQIAFLLGNPAIALGGTVYFGRGFCPDFAAPGADRRSFLHEMTHVWQYRALGIPAFLTRYVIEFLKAGGRAGRMYAYTPGVDPFRTAMLEAQAEMAADYGEALWNGDAGRARQLAANLAGSGLYGL
ncbi:MAG: hypothetical protein JO276_02375 [Sphingomonadaceae bacterium]|nr:hypothetical protein [Sphingomonadaceae bacterium]